MNYLQELTHVGLEILNKIESHKGVEMNTPFFTKIEEKYVYKTWPPELPENCNPKFQIGDTIYFGELNSFFEVEAINYLGKEDNGNEVFEYKLFGWKYPVFEDRISKPQFNQYYYGRI